MHQLNLDIVKRTWIDESIPAVIFFAMRERTFTTDELHRVIGDPPEPNWLGAMIAQLRNKKIIRKIGYRTSQRKEANGRAIAIWEIC